MRISLEARFWKYVDKTQDCWTWTASLKGNGYGGFWVKDKRDYAHRVSYRIEHGSIPDGLCVCHICDNPSCVNPEHLFLATHRENMEDCARKGRKVRK